MNLEHSPISETLATDNQAKHLSSDGIQDVWEKRFRKEGRLWGDEPSPPARFLTNKVLDNKSYILEIGAGYGRDSSWFVESGHRVTAVDRAANALTIASEDLLSKIRTRDVVYMAADFRDAALGAKSQDVFFSHRVLHLLGNNGVTEAFARLAAKTLKPDGTLLVTARSFDDFNSDQMIWKDKEQGVAVYRDDIESLGDRRGQVLYFWDEDKLSNLFNENFEDMSFKADVEMESVNNTDKDGSPVMTKYISILAKRKYTR